MEDCHDTLYPGNAETNQGTPSNIAGEFSWFNRTKRRFHGARFGSSGRAGRAGLNQNQVSPARFLLVTFGLHWGTHLDLCMVQAMLNKARLGLVLIVRFLGVAYFIIGVVIET